MRGLRWVPLVVVCVAVLGAPVVAGAATSGADEQIAEAGLLTAADFPAGWTSTPSDDSSDADLLARAKKISSCKRYLAVRVAGRKQPRAESPDFELGDSRIDNSVAVFPSIASADAVMTKLMHRSVAACIDRLFGELFEEQIASDPETRDVITGSEVDIEQFDVDGVGDAATSYEGTLVLSANDGSEATILLGVVPVQSGRAIALYSYVGDEADVQVLPALVDASLARLVAAQA